MKITFKVLSRPGRTVKIGSDKFIRIPARKVVRSDPGFTIWQIAKMIRRKERKGEQCLLRLA